MTQKIKTLLNNDIFISIISIALTLFVAAGCVGAFEKHNCPYHGKSCIAKH